MTDEERAARHLERAEQYLDEGRRDEAALELQSALQRDPNSERANAELAEIAFLEGRYRDALAYFREAHRVAPESARAALNMAKMLQQDDPEQARKLVERIVEREPDNPLGYMGRSMLALARGDTRSALTAARRATEVAPEDSRAHWEIGQVYRAKIWERRRLGLNPSDSLYQQAMAALDRYGELREERLWQA